MNKNKTIKETALEILEEFVPGFSEADQDVLEDMLCKLCESLSVSDVLNPECK